MSQLPEEFVLTVPTSVFHQVGYFQGFCKKTAPYLAGLFDPTQLRYTPRSAAEITPELKQLIAYVIFTYTSPDGEIQVFQYVRGGGGESRLHRKRSIGIGGHISSLDAAPAAFDTYTTGLARELEEEVQIGTEILSREIVGLINDDLTEVGKVHLGVVHRFECREPKVRPNETEIVESGFIPVKQLLVDTEGMETWSAICLKAIFAGE
ncbi:MAG: phosphoesterase [Thermoguttaceae bacterium]|nr:phosphoesterase [Thermoguttaceae bacterium]